jgi:hypothetical protein
MYKKINISVKGPYTFKKYNLRLKDQELRRKREESTSGHEED